MDTSAFYASLHAEDEHHHRARQIFERLRESEVKLVTTNYVLLECASLVQRRKDFASAHNFLSGAIEFLEVVWIDEPLHREAASIWSKAQSRGLSLVDCASFAAMKKGGIHKAAAFDPHFTQHGFEVIP